jgi:cell division protein FtsB
VDTSSAAPAALAAEVVAEAERLAAEPGFPTAYLARVRTAAARLAVTEGDRDDVRSAALLLEQQAVIDVEVPVASRTLPQRLVKQVVRKLVGWYVRFLGHQVGILGQATARFALVVAERLDRIEAAQAAERAAVANEIAALRARVAELEASRLPTHGVARRDASPEDPEPQARPTGPTT